MATTELVDAESQTVDSGAVAGHEASEQGGSGIVLWVYVFTLSAIMPLPAKNLDQGAYARYQTT